MTEVIQAIYDALSGHSNLLEHVSADRIRRGWQEPVNPPSIRFFNAGMKPAGDDSKRHGTVEENFVIAILADDDLIIEQIAVEVIDAMQVESLQHESVIFHSCFCIGDGRGTFFDPLRKIHRRDISFTLIYSV